MAVLRTDVIPVRYSAPIIPVGGNAAYDSQVFDPGVMVNPTDATQLLLYCSLMGAPVQDGEISIGRFTAPLASYVADPSNPANWTYTGQVLTKGTGGAWDDAYVRLNSIDYLSGTYYLSYTGNDGSVDQIGLATSSNGTSFTKSGANPILTPTGQGRNDGNYVSQGFIYREGSALTMIYSYRDAPGTILPAYRYATATTADWTSWTKGGSGDIYRTAPLYAEFHQVLKHNGLYYLVYEAGNFSEAFGCRFATSGTVTGPYTPIQSGGALFFPASGTVGAWDRYHTSTPFLIELANGWNLFVSCAGDHFQPYGTNTWPLGVATYPDFGFAGGGRRAA